YLIMKLKEVKIKNKKKGKKKTINNILKSKNIEFILKGFNMNLKASKILTTDRLSYIETAIKIFKIFSRYNLEERQNLSKKNIMLLNPRRIRRSFVNIFLLPWVQIKKREKRRRMRKTNLTTRQR